MTARDSNEGYISEYVIGLTFHNIGTVVSQNTQQCEPLQAHEIKKNITKCYALNIKPIYFNYFWNLKYQDIIKWISAYVSDLTIVTVKLYFLIVTIQYHPYNSDVKQFKKKSSASSARAKAECVAHSGTICKNVSPGYMFQTF